MSKNEIRNTVNLTREKVLSYLLRAFGETIINDNDNINISSIKNNNNNTNNKTIAKSIIKFFVTHEIEKA